jgi:hypothetical protein
MFDSVSNIADRTAVLGEKVITSQGGELTGGDYRVPVVSSVSGE